MLGVESFAQTSPPAASPASAHRPSEPLDDQHRERRIPLRQYTASCHDGNLPLAPLVLVPDPHLGKKHQRHALRNRILPRAAQRLLSGHTIQGRRLAFCGNLCEQLQSAALPLRGRPPWTRSPLLACARPQPRRHACIALQCTRSALHERRCRSARDDRAASHRFFRDHRTAPLSRLPLGAPLQCVCLRGRALR